MLVLLRFFASAVAHLSVTVRAALLSWSELFCSSAWSPTARLFILRPHRCSHLTPTASGLHSVMHWRHGQRRGRRQAASRRARRGAGSIARWRLEVQLEPGGRQPAQRHCQQSCSRRPPAQLTATVPTESTLCHRQAGREAGSKQQARAGAARGGQLLAARLAH